MLTIDQIYSEIYFSIPSVDRNEIENMDLFLKPILSNYVAGLLKNNYRQFVVASYDVSDYKAKLPKFNTIVQVLGKNTEEKKETCRKAYFQYEGLVAKSSDKDCTYVVAKSCDACETDDCNWELNFIANEANKRYANGETRLLYKLHYGNEKNSEDGKLCSSFAKDFYFMSPSLSHTFGLETKYIDNCINFDAKNDEYEFRIVDKTVHTSFKEGVLIVSYYKNFEDDNMLTMVPDLSEVKEAVKQKGITETYKFLSRTKKDKENFTLRNLEAIDLQKYESEAKNALSSMDVMNIIKIINTAKNRERYGDSYVSEVTPYYPNRSFQAIDKASEF